MVSLAAFLLRLVVLAMATVLIAGATLTVAAERVKVARPVLVPTTAGPQAIEIPDVTGQAYVFAKGILQDNGLAWHVGGPVQGFAANIVSQQSPAPRTEVVNTGAPLVTLTLMRNPSYNEQGTPENDAPYPATPIKLLPGEVLTPGNITPKLQPVKPVLPAATTPAQTTPAQTTPAQTTPAQTTPAQTTPAQTTPAQTIPAQTTPAQTTPAQTTPAPAPAAPVARTPDFTVPGAPKEPARTQSLPDRARALAVWLETHKRPTSINLNYWLYESAYIVAGARFGWWRGADALRTLIAVDQRAEVLWGVGKQSELAVRKALAEVQARTA